MIRSVALVAALVLLLPVPSPASSDAWEALIDRADAVFDQGNADSAIALGELARTDAEQSLGTQDTVVAHILNRITTYVLSQYFCGDMPRYESYLLRAREIYVSHFGEADPRVVEVLYNLAALYSNHRMNDKAAPLFHRVLELSEAIYGPDDPKTAGYLRNFGIFHFRQGKLTKAGECYSRALDIRENEAEPDRIAIAELYFLQGMRLAVQGKYFESEGMFGRSADIRRQKLGPSHPSVADCLDLMGMVNVDLGRYARAESLLEASLVMREETTGPDHPSLNQALTSLAALKFSMGKLGDAEALFTRSLQISRAALTGNHPAVADNMRHLAEVYAIQGQLARADSVARGALEIMENLHGTEHQDVTFFLDDLAEIQTRMERYDEAEALCLRSLEIKERLLGRSHPNVAVTLMVLADNCLAQGDFDRADSLGRRALAIRQEALGREHPTTAISLEFLSHVDRRKGDLIGAEQHALAAWRIVQRFFEDNAYFLSEQDALAFSGEVRRTLDNYLSCCFDLAATSPPQTTVAADVIFASKGMVADELFRRQRALTHHPDSVTRALIDSLKMAKGTLAELYVEGPGEHLDNYQKAVDSLLACTAGLDAILARRSAHYRSVSDHHEVIVDSLASRLPRDGSLVEFVRFDRTVDGSDSVAPHYAAAILSSTGGATLMDLGEADTIDSVVDAYRDHMMKRAGFGKVLPRDVDEYRNLARDLYDLVWRPIDSLLADSGTVFVCPAGGLHMVSFAGLVSDDDRYLVERYGLHYLSCGRDVIRLRQEPVLDRGLLALGDPDFDATRSARRAQFEQPDSDRASATPESMAQCRVGPENLRDIVLNPLPGTRIEVDQVASAWRRHSPEPVRVHVGAAASEEAFKVLASEYRVIHLATHGYYLPASDHPAFWRSGARSSVDFVVEDPLLRSGLFLAGANHRDLQDNGSDHRSEDGVVTAYEVSSLELMGAGLVVLSACETGLGDVRTGEGVYGLRRAFQMAGARTVISALWPVSDKDAADLVCVVYEQPQGLLPERLRTAQLDRLRSLRDQGRPDHPLSWAGFVAVGDWR